MTRRSIIAIVLLLVLSSLSRQVRGEALVAVESG